MWSCGVVVVALFFATAFCEVDVKIAKGTLRGQILRSRDGRPYYSFTGVPYAKPPIGDLRFEPPVPVDRWNGTLDATGDSNVCVQKIVADSQEDCLYLNVFTPSTDGGLPVMFWIHSGAFYKGHSNRDKHGADYFMDDGVVLVSPHTRLGALGFMSTEDDAMPGNYGLKDQVMALRWVRENIAKFGGDPGKVTIFGSSSGGMSVGYHIMSPMSKGLFHRAILQSGTALSLRSTDTVQPGVARNRSRIVSDVAGCTGATSEDTLRCLRRLPASFFANVIDHFKEWRMYPVVAFSAVVERCDSDRKGFLCKNPLNEFGQEFFGPSMIGFNSAEGGIVVASLYNDTSLLYPEFQTDFNRLMAIVMAYRQLARDPDDVGRKIFNKYYPSGKIEDHSHARTVEMITDGRYLYDSFAMAYKLSSPVYFYLYDHQNEFSFNTVYGKCNRSLGVTHGDLSISLFKMSSVFPGELNAVDTAVSKRLVKIWTTFASSGTPTVDGTVDGPKWPRFTLDDQRLLRLSSDRPRVVQNPFEEKYRFWNDLYCPMFSDF